MNIISLQFLAIFLVFFTLYWSFKQKYIYQNILLLLANAIFYWSICSKFLLLVIITVFITFMAGICLDRFKSHNYRRIVAILAVFYMVGTLFIFKYYDFFISEFGAVLNINTKDSLLRLALPVGISFYTFTAVGYVLDVYKKRVPATLDLLTFSSFLTFFPLLMSGPIERSNGLLTQLKDNRRFNENLVFDGLLQIFWGLFKKCVIADNCAPIVSIAFGNYMNLPSSSLVVGAILYSFQIYFDFSGYSDIAIGLSKMLGLRVRRNFNYPYFAQNVADFWKRWHMSLQSWFTDYIYIPLGGSRCSKTRTIVNTFIVFTVCGIWHGANWTFIVWGVYHAFLFVPLILFASKEYRRKTVSYDDAFPSLKEILGFTYTFFLITIGWIIFNSPTISSGLGYIFSMFSNTMFSAPTGIGLNDFGYIGVLLLFTICAEWTQRAKEYALQVNFPGWVKTIFVYVIIAHLVFCKAGQSDFIYLQF